MIRTDCIITLTGSFKNTGFGFSCLQKATSLSLCGEFEYLNEKEVEIIVSGGKESIQRFYQWCIDQEIPESAELTFSSTKPSEYKEFQIINQL
jgi:acylphosphatase